MQTTQCGFVQMASFMAARCGSWAGDTAAMISAGSVQPGEPMRKESAQRFRAQIIEMLDLISDPT